MTLASEILSNLTSFCFNPMKIFGLFGGLELCKNAMQTENVVKKLKGSKAGAMEQSLLDLGLKTRLNPADFVLQC